MLTESRVKPFDGTGEFQQTARPGLRRTAVQGTAVTVVSQSVGVVIQFTGTVILARLLSPDDFGLIAMVTTFSLLPLNFGLNGFTEAIVQRPRLDHGAASNVFWINASIGLALSAAFAAMAPLLVRLFREPLLLHIAQLMSATIFLTSVSVVHLALLRRDMRFLAVSVNEVTARFVGVTVSVLMCLSGWGYWALAWGAMAVPVSQTVGAVTLCRWTPGMPRRHPDTRPIVTFALNTYAAFAAGYGARNLDNILVGWFGPYSLGIYKKAYDLSMLPSSQLVTPVHSVAVPTLSRLAGDVERFRRYALRILALLAFAGMAASGVLLLIGEDLIVLLLGPQWSESGRIFTVFAAGIGARLLCMNTSFIQLSSGRADRLVRWSVIEFAVIASLFFVGRPFGAIGIASAWTVSSWILLVPALWYAGRPIGMNIGRTLSVTWKYVISSLTAVVSSWLAVDQVRALLGTSVAETALGRSAVATVLFGFFYLAAVAVLHRGWAPLREARRVAMDLLPLRGSTIETSRTAARRTAPIR